MGLEYWEHSLIGQFFGSAPQRNQIQAAFNHLWGRCGRAEELMCFILRIKALSLNLKVNKPKIGCMKEDPGL